MLPGIPNINCKITSSGFIFNVPKSVPKRPVIISLGIMGYYHCYNVSKNFTTMYQSACGKWHMTFAWYSILQKSSQEVPVIEQSTVKAGEQLTFPILYLLSIATKILYVVIFNPRSSFSRESLSIFSILSFRFID